MKIPKRNLWPFLGFGILWLLTATTAYGAEFTATLVTLARGREIPGKVFVKDGKLRHEIQVMGVEAINILRPDKKVMWVIMPQQKTYMESPVTSGLETNMLALSEEDKGKMKKVATETVNGYVCDKYEATLPYQGQSLNFFLWMAQDLKMPIKLMAQDGSLGMEYRNIAEGRLDDTLFEPPSGYRKVKMPQGLSPSG